jgi:hypothetical protein
MAAITRLNAQTLREKITDCRKINGGRDSNDQSC